MTPEREAEWLEWRRGGITGTDVARWWTGQYGGAYGVVADKLGIGPKRTAPTARQARGHAWEARLAAIVHHATGLHVHATGDDQVWAEHPDRPHHRATPDGLLAPTAEVYDMAELVGTLETKTRGVGVERNAVYWTAQIQWGLHVTGLPWCELVDAIVADVDDRLIGLRLDRIDADLFIIDQLAEGADWLWDHVQRGVLPDPDSDTALDYVKAVHARSDPTADTVELGELDLVDAVHRYAQIGQAVKDVQAEKAKLAAQLRHALGPATRGSTPDGWRVTLSNPSRELTPYARHRLAEAHPDVAVTTIDLDLDRAVELYPDDVEAAKTPTGPRSLRVNPPKAERPRKRTRKGGPTT